MTAEHPLLTTWKTQRREVIRRIARDPDRFWYWRIRLRVLDYLLSRYSRVSIDALPHPDDVAPPQATSRHLGDLSSTSLNVRDSQHIRALLERIHTTVSGASRY